MKCHRCEKNKLSKEFPDEHLTEECADDHALLHCLRCVTACIKDHHTCSQCNVLVTEDNKHYQKYIQTLEFLFPIVAADESESVRQTDDGSTAFIIITTLSGEYISIDFNAEQTIIQIKNLVQEKLKTPIKKQCLLYNDTELEVAGKLGGQLKLKDYNIQPNSTINLLVLLYEVPEDYDRVIFDLFWGYPESRKDFLDASVLLYSGSAFVEVVDFGNRLSKSNQAVQHSGDVMDDKNRLGHHTINVSIKSIPSHIDRLVFTLSAWRCPSISEYPNPSLKFFDARNPIKQLCDDKMDDVANSQAVIMCFLTNRGDKWRVTSVKHLSAGNAMDYEPLKNTIVNLILLEKGLN